MNLFKKSKPKLTGADDFSLFKASKPPKETSDTNEPSSKPKKIIIGDVQDIDATTPSEGVKADSGPSGAAPEKPLEGDAPSKGFSGVFKSRKKAETPKSEKAQSPGNTSNQEDVPKEPSSVETSDSGLKFKSKFANSKPLNDKPNSSASQDKKPTRKIPLVSLGLIVVLGVLAIADTSLKQELVEAESTYAELTRSTAELRQKLEGPLISTYVASNSTKNWGPIMEIYAVGGHPDMQVSATFGPRIQTYNFKYNLKNEGSAYDFTKFAVKDLPLLKSTDAHKCTVSPILPEGSSHEFNLKATCNFD